MNHCLNLRMEMAAIHACQIAQLSAVYQDVLLSVDMSDPVVFPAHGSNPVCSGYILHSPAGQTKFSPISIFIIA